MSNIVTPPSDILSAAKKKKIIIPIVSVSKPTVDYYRAKSEAVQGKFPDPIAYSLLGTKLFDTLVLTTPSEYTWYDFETKVEGNTITLTNCQLTPSMSKNVVMKNISGSGTYKQIIGEDDLIVNVSGFLNTKTNFKPIDEKSKLFDVLRAPVVLAVSSQYLNNIFGFSSFVVSDMNFDNEPDKLNRYKYSFTMYSDVDYTSDDIT